MAKKIKKEVYVGGIEDRIVSFGNLLLFLGIMGLFFCILMAVDVAGSSKTYNSKWVVVLWIILGFSSFIGSIAIFTILRGFSEIIRILKKQNNLPYSGEILQPRKKIVLCCSNCGKPIKKIRLFYSKCVYCSESFQKE